MRKINFILLAAFAFFFCCADAWGQKKDNGTQEY